MGGDDTTRTQGVLKFCPRVDGEDKAYALNNKDNLRVVLSIHRQSVTVIPKCGPKPTAAHSSMAVATWTCSNQNLFSLQIFPSARSANKFLKKHMDKTLQRIKPVTDMRRGVQWKRSTVAIQSRIEEHTINTTPRGSPAMIPMILSTASTAITNVSRSWASQYPMRGTRTSFFKLFLSSTSGSVQPARRDGIFTWQTFDAR